MQLNIQPFLRRQVKEFISGFFDGLYSRRPVSPTFNRQEYINGYANGAQYKDELSGISCMSWLRY